MPKNESVLIRLENGTLARIDEVLERFEDRSPMLREAIEREIERRKNAPTRVDRSKDLSRVGAGSLKRQ